MCLFSYHKTPRIATSDIICYKIMDRAKLSDRLFRRFDYISPLYTFKWKINKLYYQKFEEPELANYGVFAIKVGFHARLLKEGLIAFSDTFPNKVIVKCIIPKGTNYFSSVDNRDIVAEQMIIVKKIK